MDKQNMVYRYSGILLDLKRKALLTHAITQENSDTIMVSKIRQSQKRQILHDFHLHEVSTETKFIEIENRMVAARCWGERKGMQSCCLMGVEIVF